MSEFWYTVAGIVFGGIVSAVISYIFARKASKELREEAEDLRRETREVRRYVEVLMGFLEDAGQIAVTRDDRGRPTNVRILRGGGIYAPRPGSMGGGELTVTSPEEPEPPQGREDGP
jgi:hypothetical protein